MELPNNSIPIDNLSLSLANLSFSGQSPSETQESVFNNSNRPAVPLYPHQSIRASIPGNINQIFTGLNNEMPAISNSEQEKVEDLTFLKLAITPEGSRKLQETIRMAGDSMVSRLVEINTSKISGIPLIYHLMIDPFGCHVCSKLFDVCNKLQLGFLVENIAKYDEIFVGVAMSLHGAKLMKKLIKSLKGSSFSSLIVFRMSLSFNRLMRNKTGSYVVNCCLDCLHMNQNIPLYEAGISEFLALATDVVGCISLNYMIDKIQGFHRQQLLELVAKNAVFLSHDPSGNHVVQKVLGLENPTFTTLIVSMLRGHYVKLSTQKWGSYVVKKCLKSEAGMDYVGEDFLHCSSNELLQIAKDQFGNYVIQTALNLSKHRNVPLYRRLVEIIQSNLSVLRFGYGKNIYNLINSEIHYSNVV